LTNDLTFSSPHGMSPSISPWGWEMKGIRQEYRPGKWRIRFPFKGKRYDIYSIEIKGTWYPLSENTSLYLHQTLSKYADEPGFDINDFLNKKDRPFSFDQACDLWINASACSMEWIEARERIAKKYLKPFFMGFDIRDIKQIHLYEFIKHLRSNKLSDKTIYNYVGELRALLHFHAESLSKIPAFPKIAVQEPTIHWLSAEQQDMVFEFIPEHDLPIFTFMRWTGCRPNEAAGLLRENIFRDKGIVVLATAIGDKGQLKQNTKTRKSKPLPIIPEIEWTFIPKRLGRFVFQTMRGRIYRKRRLEAIWDSAMRKAIEKYPDRITRVPLYQGLKHSFGGQRINAGYSLDQIAAVMGHTDTRTTAKYAKLKVEKLAEVMRGKQP
jgi:integrase